MVVTGNRLSGSRGIAIEGGGVFTEVPITLERSRIAGNAPGQCRGC